MTDQQADRTPQALSNTVVADFTSGPAGGLASTVLADFGATVIKIEPPGGDRFRKLAASPMWLRGKRSMVIDLSTDAGRAQAHDLATQADVVLVGGPPSRIARWGLDWNTLSADAPHLVHCAITGWGAAGPYAELPGYEGLVAAATGRMASYDVQLRQGRPVYAALPVATHIASQAAVHGVVAALLQRLRTGVGARVETSLVQGMFPFDLMDLLTSQIDDDYVPLRQRSAMPTLNYHPLRCADGQWIQCGNLLEHLFYSFLDATDLLGELLIDERFQGSPAVWSEEAIEEARDRMLTRMLERPAAEWMQVFADSGNVAAEPILDAQAGLAHPDIALGGALAEIVDPVVGATTQIGPIAELTATPAVVGEPAPVLGECTTPIARESVDNERATATPGRPLGGVTIIDLSAIIAGPLGISMLADLGARVIKVEPLGGDPFRHLTPGGRIALKMNCGKESICIDLKTPAGQEVLHRLVADADVVVHNFREGVPEKLGLDWPTLSAINPQLIWTVVNGYGPHGPSAKRPATHPVMGAASGAVAYQAGDALTRDCPTLAELRETARELMAANDANPDPNTSVVAASAILLALLARDRHGIGQRVLVNMQVANAWANSDDFLRYEGKPDRLAIDAGRHGLSARYRLYPTADGWVFFAAPTDAEMTAFASAVDRADLASSIDDVTLAALFAERTADEWEAMLVPLGIGCVRADGVEVADVFRSHPAVIDNGWSPKVHNTRFGDHHRWGPTVTVDGPHDNYRSAPLAGEQTDAILSELGFSDNEIVTLRADKVVASEAVNDDAT